MLLFRFLVHSSNLFWNRNLVQKQSILFIHVSFFNIFFSKLFLSVRQIAYSSFQLSFSFQERGDSWLPFASQFALCYCWKGNRWENWVSILLFFFSRYSNYSLNPIMKRRFTEKCDLPPLCNICFNKNTTPSENFTNGVVYVIMWLLLLL